MSQGESGLSIKTSASAAGASVLAIHDKQDQANRRKCECAVEMGWKLQTELMLSFFVTLAPADTHLQLQFSHSWGLQGLSALTCSAN